jgi:hypothetical protein
MCDVAAMSPRYKKNECMNASAKGGYALPLLSEHNMGTGEAQVFTPGIFTSSDYAQQLGGFAEQRPDASPAKKFQSDKFTKIQKKCQNSF